MYNCFTWVQRPHRITPRRSADKLRHDSQAHPSNDDALHRAPSLSLSLSLSLSHKHTRTRTHTHTHLFLSCWAEMAFGAIAVPFKTYMTHTGRFPPVHMNNVVWASNTTSKWARYPVATGEKNSPCPLSAGHQTASCSLGPMWASRHHVDVRCSTINSVRAAIKQITFAPADGRVAVDLGRGCWDTVAGRTAGRWWGGGGRDGSIERNNEIGTHTIIL